ncbi:ammonium transporter AmtB-like domain-containing protein [Radiomyces spectabilis]|uniref:ammonium transporter AmtB-like domain-containing protein n=1 Tax=Radiomyces spectabilis TaxID=64574 RepID=UPI00221F18F2|nr:ammonium transporter AmtB-like domain-containing protein [Radiomyces spectabilis]KAI8390946.1 ammonium transporter AmtB-like domain-containing protein [Radiomyces spectabilis]
MAAYTIDNGDTAWVMVCAALVFLMSPALGFFYAGLARAKNALSLMYLTVLSVAVVSIQWYLIGYSLTFSETGGAFIGDARALFIRQNDLTEHFLLRGVGQAPQLPSQTVPASVFMIFQAMFACITPALAFGSAAERMSLGPAIIFVFVWTTLVYDVITCWVWGPQGWLAKLGVMDYAGGTPVHIASGLAAVAYAMVLGKRRDYNENVNTPHNVSFVFLGLALLWFGWFAFNAGSALAANARSVNSLVCTHLSACVAAMVWILLDYRRSRKWSIIGLCTGAVAGLATVTPGSGFVSPSSSLAFGAIGSIVCNIALNYKHKYRFDDALDVFAVHYIGGLVGLLLTGIFAQQSVIALGYPEGTSLDMIPQGGWLDGNWMQLPIQLAAIASVSGWSFVVTYAILILLNKIPAFKLRLDDEAELLGTDLSEMGERAYSYLPLEDDQKHTRTASASSSDIDAVNETMKVTHTHPPTELFGGALQQLMTSPRDIVKGVPELIEPPVQQSHNPSHRSSNPRHTVDMIQSTGGAVFQKSSAQVREEKQEQEFVGMEDQPMSVTTHMYHNNRPNTHHSTSTSSTTVTKENEK